MNQYVYIRAQTVCPNCRQDKKPGVILCWPCHHAQKNHNDGCYSKRLECKLAAMDQALQDAGAAAYEGV